jgi:hypothetical protein
MDTSDPQHHCRAEEVSTAADYSQRRTYVTGRCNCNSPRSTAAFLLHRVIESHGGIAEEGVLDCNESNHVEEAAATTRNPNAHGHARPS